MSAPAWTVAADLSPNIGRVKPGETIALISDYRNEKNGDKESSELVFLLTPRFLEKGLELNGPEFKLSREAAALKKSRGNNR